MTPKEQAEILVDEYYQLIGEHIFNGHFDLAKQCALIAVDELINCTLPSCDFGGEINYLTSEYWEEVKKEIELL